MNNVNLIGNLVRAPEEKQTQKGVPVALFTIAVNRIKSQSNPNPGADFIQCKCYGKRAEICIAYLGKGSKVGITGSINTYSYEANDGSKRYVTEVLAQQITFLSSGPNATQNSSSGHADPDYGDDYSQPFPEDDLPY